MRYRSVSYGIIFICIFLSTANASVEFNATTTEVNCSSNTSLDNMPSTSGGFTCCAWINADGVGEGNVGRILGKGSNGSAGDWRFFTDGASGTNRLRFVMDCAVDMDLRSNDSFLVPGSWQFVCIRGDGGLEADNYDILVDGNEVTYAQATDCGTSIVSDGTLNFVIGNDDTGVRTFDGKIEEISCWKGAELSDEEIKNIYRSRTRGLSLQVRKDNLSIYQPLDNCADNQDCPSLADRSGNSNTCTATGNPIGKAGEVLSYP